MADTATTEETEVRFEGDQWVFLIDPAWQAQQAEEPVAEGAEPPRPPLEAVVGGWFVEQDGETSRFHANPAYEPSTPDSPTDPVDATLQLVVRGEAEAEQLLSTMVEAAFGLAVDSENTPVVVLSPDEVPSVLVATAPLHSRRISENEALEDVAAWAEVTLEQLVGLLPEEGVDVLLNAGAPSSMRLIAAALRDAVTDFGEAKGAPAEVRTESEDKATTSAPPKTESGPKKSKKASDTDTTTATESPSA